jgi:hypothetical protein
VKKGYSHFNKFKVVNHYTRTNILSEEELNSPRGKQPIFVNALAKGYYA